mgnify:CR=1 FL=1
MNGINVKRMELGPISTNAFVLWETDGADAVLVDVPPMAGDKLRQHLAEHGLRVSEIWLTHGHWDHMGGVHEFAGEGVKIRGHRADEQLFLNPRLTQGVFLPGLELLPAKITHWLEDGEFFDLWGRRVETLHCPGHCPGNVAFYLPTEEICFAGDVIFSGSVGRTDLPGGDYKLLETSILQKIYSLPDEVTLAVGHGPDTSVGREKATNPFVRA